MGIKQGDKMYALRLKVSVWDLMVGKAGPKNVSNYLRGLIYKDLGLDPKEAVRKTGVYERK